MLFSAYAAADYFGCLCFMPRVGKPLWPPSRSSSSSASTEIFLLLEQFLLSVSRQAICDAAISVCRTDSPHPHLVVCRSLLLADIESFSLSGPGRGQLKSRGDGEAAAILTQRQMYDGGDSLIISLYVMLPQIEKGTENNKPAATTAPSVQPMLLRTKATADHVAVCCLPWPNNSAFCTLLLP